MLRRPSPRRRATHSRSRIRTKIMRAFLFLVPVDRDKRIDRHIDYFGSPALAAGVTADRRTRSR